MDATDDRTISADIISATAEFVAALFRDYSDKILPFHNYRHTTEVVQAARKIGSGEGLAEDDLEIVTVAAWLHDVGYFQAYQGHEEKSAETARSFLSAQGYAAEKIEKVVGCILATRYPQQPATLPERVICDADMAHLGSNEAAEKAARLRAERFSCCGESYSDREWRESNLSFMRRQRYHTETARRLYDGALQENIRREEGGMEEKEEEKDPQNGLPEPMRLTITTEERSASAKGTEQKTKEEKEEKKEKKIKKLRKELRKIQEELESAAAEESEGGKKTKELQSNTAARLDRGIETMFKTTSRNHIDLSSMADSKANIMISVNSIIISIVASVLLGKLDTDPHYIIPTVILLAVCLTTIIFAVLATRPKVTSGTFTQEDIDAKKVNLLFFGNFHSVDLEDYHRGVMAMMNDSDYLYGSMIKDIYFLGQVLGRKYKFLRFSYNTFMYGLIISVLAFVIASIIGPPSPDVFVQP